MDHPHSSEPVIFEDDHPSSEFLTFEGLSPPLLAVTEAIAPGPLLQIKEWFPDADLITHYHDDNPCHDFTCDFWWWNDNDVKDAIPDRWRQWAGHDILKAVAATQLRIRDDIKLLTGPTATIGGKRIRIIKLVMLISAILTSGVVGANLRRMIGMVFG